jgi:hypothetical protein
MTDPVSELDSEPIVVRSEIRDEPLSVDEVLEALEITRTARTILGANGISPEFPVIRHMNNLEPMRTYEGTVEMHTLVLGQVMTGISAFRCQAQSP